MNDVMVRRKVTFKLIMMITVTSLLLSLFIAIVVSYECNRNFLMYSSDNNLSKIMNAAIDGNGNVKLIVKQYNQENGIIMHFFFKVFGLVFLLIELLGMFLWIRIKKEMIDPLCERIALNKKASEKDGMTGICNRRRYYKRISDYNECRTMGVLFIDVNDLKKTNDQYGHVAGDELICAVANTIKRLAVSTKKKNIDYYRIGGDEFLMVLPDSTEEQLIEIATRLRNLFESIELELSPIKVSAAIGIAFSDDFDFDIEELKKEADEEMYRLKKIMKNNYE